MCSAWSSARSGEHSACPSTRPKPRSIPDPTPRELIVDDLLLRREAEIGRLRRPGHRYELVVGDRLDAQELGRGWATAALVPCPRGPAALIVDPPASLPVKRETARGLATAAETHGYWATAFLVPYEPVPVLLAALDREATAPGMVEDSERPCREHRSLVAAAPDFRLRAGRRRHGADDRQEGAGTSLMPACQRAERVREAEGQMEAFG